jgi:hypothetical protein
MRGSSIPSRARSKSCDSSTADGPILVAHAGAEVVRAEPYEANELDLTLLWEI